MNDFDKILNQLKNSSGEMKPNMHMLNEIVPVEEQMKYFQYSKYVQSQDKQMQPDRNYMISHLFTPEINIEDKRYYLSVLAIIGDIPSYRAIETYHSSPLEEELTNWSALALVESRILLDADLSGEKQFFVSTGLGGKEGKLRYFAVIASADRSAFSDFQNETFLKELKFAYQASDIELESIDFKSNYVKFFLLCGLNHDPRACTEQVIAECNTMGYFIDKRFILTNVKLINDTEIEKLLKSTKEQKDDAE